MRKILFLFLALFVLTASATVSAKSHNHQDSDDNHQNNGRQADSYEKHKHNNHHDWSSAAYHDQKWQRGTYETISFGWHEHSNRFEPERYRMERIHDERWGHRFPGLYPYHWEDRNGEGFWYRGHHVNKAVFFYNDADELVSIGFMHNGVFVFVRDDHSAYRNHDSFFISWSSRD